MVRREQMKKPKIHPEGDFIATIQDLRIRGSRLDIERHVCLARLKTRRGFVLDGFSMENNFGFGQLQTLLTTIGKHIDFSRRRSIENLNRSLHNLVGIRVRINVKHRTVGKGEESGRMYCSVRYEPLKKGTENAQS